MARDIQPQHLSFEGELVLGVPFFVGYLDVEHGRDRLVGVVSAEKIELPYRLGLLGAHHRIDRVGVHQHQALARVPERVESACLDEGFGDLLRARRGVDLIEVVGEVGELPLLLPGCDDRRHHIGADVAYGAETEPDVHAHRGEIDTRCVDIRWQHDDAPLATVCQVDRRLVFVVADGGEQAGHVLGGEVGLEVCGPIHDQAVSGGV